MIPGSCGLTPARLLSAVSCAFSPDCVMMVRSCMYVNFSPQYYGISHVTVGTAEPDDTVASICVS